MFLSQLAQRILEAHANVRDMNLLEAKMNYIKAWQALPEYGITHFIIRMKGSKKEVSSSKHRERLGEVGPARCEMTQLFPIPTHAVTVLSKLKIVDADCKHNFIFSFTSDKLNTLRDTYFPLSAQELLGIAFNRMIRMDLSSGDSVKTWRFSNMQTWNVNWEIKQLEVRFDDEVLAFQCLTADCKVKTVCIYYLIIY